MSKDKLAALHYAAIKAVQAWERATPGTVTKEKAWIAYQKAEKAFSKALETF